MSFFSWMAELWRERPDAAPELSNAPQQRGADPTAASAAYQAGVAAFNAGDFIAAARCFGAAIEARHDDARAYDYLGLSHLKQDHLEDAADCFVMATHFRPEYPEAFYHLALVAQRRGAHRDAVASLERATALRQDYADAHNALGASLLELGDVERAAAEFEQAIAAQPDFAFAHNNLGYVLLRDLGDYERGIAHIETALRLAPHDPGAWCNYTMSLSHQGRLDEAIVICDRLLAARPDMHEARLNRALAALRLGRFAEAWPDYEARKLVRSNYIPRAFPFTEWRGEALVGKTILAYAEQGLGDEIMFASCLPELIARAGHCVVECSPRLEKLFARSFPDAVVHAGGQAERDQRWLSSLGRVDYQVAIGSLPAYFRRQRADFPAHQGYLHAGAGQTARWRERLRALGSGLKVGISWRGGMASTRRELRSMQLLDWLPLLKTPGCDFVSLQYGECGAELVALAGQHGFAAHHWPQAIEDYDETAALVAALDLVISVQTAVVHLSGALGRPAWALVPAVPEWRYQQSGETMPWYPGVRLLRQPQLGDWQPVVARAAQDLAQFTRR